jgi:hypothetical protein
VMQFAGVADLPRLRKRCAIKSRNLPIWRWGSAERVMRQDRRIPTEVPTLKERFAALNKWVSENGGWLISVPGEAIVRLECLPNSSLPNALADQGYDLFPEPEGWGERILASAITEHFVMNSRGELEPLTEGSTAPITSTVTHAGIVKTRRFAFAL